MSGKYDLDEAAASWDAWLDEFEEHLMPVFARRGVPLAAALMAYELNVVYNKLCRINPEPDGDGDGDDWKRSGDDKE